MASKDVLPLYRRMLKTKAALLAVSFTLIGILLIMLNAWLATLSLGDWSWLHHLPLDEVGGPLLGAGLVSTILDYSYRRDQEDVAIQRTQQAIIDLSPAKLWSVLCEGLARHPAELVRLTTPERLDDAAAAIMAQRLGDEQFAREIYADIRDQAIRAAEQWYDVEARVRLSTAVERSTAGTPLLDVAVEWEYTTVPSGSERRFACVSDRAAYNALRGDIPATSTWFMAPRPGMDARSRESYELLELTVDGRPQPIRRTVQATGQTYRVQLDDAAQSGKPVRIRQIFRTSTPAWGHRLFFELPQPARNMSLAVDYTNTPIADIRVSDTVATFQPSQLVRTPEAAFGKVVSLNARGWLLPKTGFAVTWTLESELPHDAEHHEAA
ncbi:hypothetical protein [Actinomyces oris]|uniref:hypothetical protein n=1 Tax=Actinomyces oris TaxID=544580 RepID=UPI0028E703FE|nr:hypothetical protein [Actinomyces oris]